MTQLSLKIGLPIALAVCIHSLAACANIGVNTIHIGNAGNASHSTGFGAVAYEYRIGRYEVTNDQYATFLNAKAVSDPLNLYHTNMGTNVRGGITQSGSSGSYSYTTKPSMGNKPVNYVNWYDAIRFANWLHNDQGSGDTETGAYTLGALGAGGIPVNGNTIVRNGGATWFLPKENEWYKAAFYNPLNSTYFNYPTSSSFAPDFALAAANGDVNNPGLNVANYSRRADWNGQDGNVTTVGTAGAISPYGAYDQAGNVEEWNEELIIVAEFTNRVQRGGAWNTSSATTMHATTRAGGNQDVGVDFRGFRVARTPITVVPGDFNGDGTVDAADYVVWRKNNGSPAEFNTWRANFGNTLGSGANTNAAVPEPASYSLAILALMAVTYFRRTRRT